MSIDSLILKKFRSLAIVFLCLIIATFALPSGAESQKTGWTVLIYMVGSNLESDDIMETGGNATGDLEEMVRSVRDDTELLVMTGGASRWWGMEGMPEIPADKCCVWHVTSQSFQCLWEGVGSMGSPEMLEALLDWLPSEENRRTAMIFWNHGYGPLGGFGNDETAEDGTLTLSEIVSAFENRGMSERPFSFIGFDACLMGSCETVLTMAPYARYLVASEDIEPNDGWDYGFLQSLSDHTSAEEAGREIIQRYQEHNKNRKDAYGLSLIDLKQATALQPAVEALFGKLEEQIQSGAFSAVSGLRSDSWDYARTTTGTDYDLVDLKELAEKSGAGQEVLEALSACILDYQGNRERAHGLSIYFPQKAGISRRAAWQSELEILSPGQNWLSFIKRYEEAMNGGAKTTYEAAETAEQPYTVQLTEDQRRDFASANYVVFEENSEGAMRIVYAGNNCVVKDGSVQANYQGKTLWFCSEDQKAPIVSILHQEDSGNAYYLSAAVIHRYHGDGLPWPTAVDLQIVRDKATDQWSIMSVYPVDDELGTGRQEISLNDYQLISLASGGRKPKRNEEGVLLPWKQWDSTGNIFGYQCYIKDTYSIEEEELHREEGNSYWLQVIIKDVYNNEYASELFPV